MLKRLLRDNQISLIVFRNIKIQKLNTRLKTIDTCSLTILTNRDK